MGFMRDKGPRKPRSGVGTQPTSSPRPVQCLPPPRLTSNKPHPVTMETTIAASAPPASKKEEDQLRGTSSESLLKANNITTTTNNNNNYNTRTKVVVDALEDKADEKPEQQQNETEDSLILALGEISISEDNDLNKQIKNLTIKENQNKKERSEESDLLSRGPDRVCMTGNTRTAPYLYEQHIVSSDRNGGGTVRYPNISPPHQVIGYPQGNIQEFIAANFPNSSQDSGIFPNVDYYNGRELEDVTPGLPDEPLELNEEDFIILGMVAQKCINDLNDSLGDDIDKIIESKKDDKDIQPIKRELCEAAIDRQPAPTTPDSAYDSDECSVGSPSSVTSGVMRTEIEKVATTSVPYTHTVLQPTNLCPQPGFASAPISPVIQAVPIQSPMLVLLQQPKPVMPPPPPPPPPILPQSQQRPQPLAPPSTPPLSPQILRPILPGINIPADCNRCNEPAITRIRSAMVEQIKDKAWAVIFADPETKFTDVDKDGNMCLSRVLSNSQNMENFMEVLYALIHRIKEIINNDRQMAHKLLATSNNFGYTPLDIACRFLRSTSQNALAVRYLADTMVEEGLEIGKETDGNGNTLLHKLSACGDKACYIMAEFLSMKDRQGKSVFDVNHKNHEGKTPLHIVAQSHSDQTSCTVLAQLLMRSGADVSLKEGCAGNTVFHLVAQVSCDPKLLLTLLAKTSYTSRVINEKNFNEDTPLHMVAANHEISPARQREAVQHLIDYGADPRIQNKSRKVPLSLVPGERKPAIKNVLYQK